ncbi:M48 family metallopeptidase [Ectothiorhodospiraceae bacterium WFHF3C12]|nr:M48 family metallopeptidase [Ectothiorhodospiraceae bacterium WFHF3C12]
MPRPVSILLTLALALMSAAAAAQNRLPTMGDPANSVMTPNSEAQFGAELMREVRRRLPLVSDPEIVDYVEDLGRRLTSHAETPEFSYHFFVVDAPGINAFAMPGGYVGINAGLILAADTESQLAGVMAHEIAHVGQRHMARQMAAAQRINAQTIALVLAGLLLGAQDPEAGSAAVMSGVAGAREQQLAYSRDHENEADRVGMQILVNAGFDPRGMGEFFERLMRASRYQDRPPPFLSTHPLTQQRVAEANARAERLAQSESFNTGLFELMRAKLRVINAETPAVALEHFEQAASDQASSANRYGLALALGESGDYERAEQLLNELIDADGERIPYLLARAELARTAGRLQPAREHFEDALSLYPDSYALRFRYAQALVGAGAGMDAMQQADRLLREHEERPSVHRLKAEAADLAGESVEAKLAMAQYYRLLGDLRSAVSQLRQVRDSPYASDIQRSRAQALEEDWAPGAAPQG